MAVQPLISGLRLLREYCSRSYKTYVRKEMLESGLFTSKINIGLESGIHAETPRDNGECQVASVRS